MISDARLLAAIERARSAKRPPHALRGGAGAKLHPRDVPVRSLLAGARVELEHGYSPKRAIEIALDHLAEDRAYYTRLRRVHRERPAKRRRKTYVVLGRAV